MWPTASSIHASRPEKSLSREREIVNPCEEACHLCLYKFNYKWGHEFCFFPNRAQDKKTTARLKKRHNKYHPVDTFGFGHFR